jgi:hypothetical protein
VNKLKEQPAGVTDVPSEMKFVIEVLGSLKLDVVIATTSKEALELLRRQDFDVIISDMNRDGVPNEGIKFLQKSLELGLSKAPDGACLFGAMADWNEAIRPRHDRIPVLLHPHEYEQWLRGSFEDLLAFQKRCFPDDLIEIHPTSELWVKKKAPASSEARHCSDQRKVVAREDAFTLRTLSSRVAGSGSATGDSAGKRSSRCAA